MDGREVNNGQRRFTIWKVECAETVAETVNAWSNSVRELHAGGIDAPYSV